MWLWNFSKTATTTLLPLRLTTVEVAIATIRSAVGGPRSELEYLAPGSTRNRNFMLVLFVWFVIGSGNPAMCGVITARG
jgi:hypothetical protein